MDVSDLIAFENDTAECFNRAEIRAVVHLSGGNERELIDIFKRIARSDYVCGQWRMHYHCLLKGVPPERLKADIRAGHSIALCYPEYRIISSGIAGGIAPIAVGIAAAIKDQNLPDHVWCFLGDMTEEMGICHEAIKYSENFDLPVTFVTEDNGLSVCTNTREAWGINNRLIFKHQYYEYKLTRPHVGTGQWVTF